MAEALRFRSQGGYPTITYPGRRYRSWNSSGTLLSDTGMVGSWTYSGSGTYAEMRDVVTEDFRKRVANGEIINNPMTRTIDRKVVAVSSPFYKSRDNASGNISEEAWTDYPRVVTGHCSLPDLVGLMDEAVTKAWAGVNPPDWQGGVSVGEGKDTVRMLAGPVKALVSIARKVVSGQVNKFVRIRTKQADGSYRLVTPPPGKPITISTIAGGASAVWLTYRLGVTPLLCEVDAILNDLFQDEWEQRLTSRAKASRSDTAEAMGGNYSFNSAGYSVTWRGTLRSTRYAEARAGILYLPTRSALHAAGFGAQDILPTAWALVPYSFVVDRFLLVNDYIQGLQNYLTCRTLASWVVLKSLTYSWHTWDQCSESVLSGYTGIACQRPSGISTFVTEQTIRRTGVGPSLTLKYSGKKTSLQVKHTLDHLALIIAPFLGRHR